jgi:Glyoxalase-like domain
MGVPLGLTFDCADPKRVGTFWQKVLGYVEKPPPEGYGSREAYDADHGVSAEEAAAGYGIVDPDGTGPPIFFQKVPEPKVVKNRLHIDIRVGGERGTPFEERRRRIEASVEPLIAAGASFQRRSDDPDDYFIVMQDPEGNEFCLV